MKINKLLLAKDYSFSRLAAEVKQKENNRLSRCCFLPVLLMCLFVLSSSAYGFGKVGHKVVCELAYQSLSVVNQHKLDNLLALIPKDHKQMINGYAREKKNAKVTFANACLWADALKKHRNFSIIYKKYKPWHYVNVERDVRAITKDNTQADSVAHAVSDHLQEFQQKKISWPKTQALLFLGHWLADIHQPFHASFASDLGGNRLKIHWLADADSQSDNYNMRKCQNMHSLWDDCLLRHWHKKTHPKLLVADHVATLTQKIQRLTAKQRQAIIDSDPWQWASESLALVRNPQVKYCQQQEDNDFCLPFRVKTMYLLPDYHYKFAPVALDRLMYASLRLGNMLKQNL